MKKYKYLLILLPFMMGSCEEDFLEKTNYNSVDTESFMKIESQAKEAVTAIYDPLTHYGMYNISQFVLGEVATDNITNDWGDGGFGPDIVRTHQFNWTGTNQYFVGRWNSCYKGIYRANYLLDNIEGIAEIADASKDQFMGEAKFLRALYYFHLVSGFGDVPMVTTVLTANETNNLSKTPAADIWTLVIADLEDAADLLPETYSAENLGRVTKGGAYGLLSRVKLWTKDYAGAEAAALATETLGYTLVSDTDYIQMFDGRMENSSESLFEAQLTPAQGSIWNSDKAEGSLMMHIFPRVSWGRYFTPRKTASYDLLNAFEANDIRREASFLITGQDQIFYPSTGATSVFPDLAIHADFRADLQVNGVYQMRKFLPYDDIYWRAGGAFFKVSTAINIPIVRYAEVILNKAEALVEQNKLTEAWDELEKIRLRAGLDMIGVSKTDQNALRTQIREDRRVELIFEGHRWGDLKRWDDLGSLTAAGLNYSGQTDWPIPSQEIAINAKLGE
jgi:hypothetical protein